MVDLHDDMWHDIFDRLSRNDILLMMGVSRRLRQVAVRYTSDSLDFDVSKEKIRKVRKHPCDIG